MTEPGLLIHLGTEARDGTSFSAVTLIRCDEPNPAVAVLVVVPLNKRCNPAAGFLYALGGPPGVVGPVFDRAEQRFRKGVVVAHPGSGEGSEHPQPLQAALQRGGPHGIAVVGMEDQGMGTPLADPLLQADPVHQIRGDFGVFPIDHLLGHYFTGPHVDHQVEIQPHTTHAGGQIGDVSTPNLIRSSGLQPWHFPWLLGRPGTTTAVGLAMGREHPVEAPL